MGKSTRHRPPRLASSPAVVALVALILAFSPALLPGTAIAFRGPSPPTLTLQAPGQSVAGQDVNVVAVLHGGPGQPQGGRPVTLLLDGVQIGMKFTDFQGQAAFSIPGSALAGAGTYLLMAVAGGRRGSVSATASLVVTAVTVAGASSRGTAATKRTSLSLALPTGSALGQDVAVTAILNDGSGRPIAGQHLALMLDGVPLKSDSSNPNGQVAFSIPGKKLDQAGTYAVQATFPGSHGYAASAANATLTVEAAAIQIVTVPPLAGLGFSLGGSTAVTGPDGVAALPVPASGMYKLTADLNPDQAGTPSVRASFVRWADDVYTANRTIVVAGPATYVMGLRVAYSARVAFVDLAGRAVDPKLVGEADFRGADGAAVALNPQTGATKVWLTANTAAAAPAGALTASAVNYRAVSVKIHGLEALDPGQAPWDPNTDGPWTIRLRLYDLSVRAQDAIVGTVGSGQLHLKWSDGTLVSKPVGADGTASFSGLPAGNYVLSLGSLTVPIALSGSQIETLRVVTPAEIAVAIGAGIILVGLVALALGRWVWLRRRQASAPTPAPAD